MITVNIHEAKTHLSRYLQRVEKGEKVILCRRNKPVAEIVPIQKEAPKKRVFGLCKGQFELGPEFFEPLPDELLRLFNGEGE